MCGKIQTKLNLRKELEVWEKTQFGESEKLPKMNIQSLFIGICYSYVIHSKLIIHSLPYLW